jgi:hypothetical protein
VTMTHLKKPEPTITRVFEAMGWTVEGNDK